MFGKKKKNGLPPPEPPPVENKTNGKKGKGGKKGDTKDLVPVPDPQHKPSEKKRWKFFSKKLIIVLFLLISVGIAGFVVYKIYFSKKADGPPPRVYVKRELPNVILAEEIIRFTYDFIPEFYESTVLFNDQILILANEIKRLTALGKQFPDQIKIAEKEIKVIEKESNKLKQTYEKLEKRVEALYVSYRVNQEAGFQQIEAQKVDISAGAKESLTPVLELTKRIQTMVQSETKPPEGFVKGTIYKVRQKINSLIK